MSGDVERCGYSVTDLEGDEQPCDRVATGWRWYQDTGEHEDLLDRACDWHANEGGRRLHAAEGALRRVEALAESAKLDAATSLSRTFDGGTFGAWIDADRILAALGDQP